MKKTPCEYIVWNVLPCIRKHLAEALHRKGLSQREVASMLGVSDAAISQYLSDKRGSRNKFDPRVMEEIEKSADVLINGGDVVEEICRICSFIKKEKMLEEEIC